MDVVIKNLNQLESTVKKSVMNRLKKVFEKGDVLLNEQAEVLRQVFANSEEFRSLKGKFKGEFGFTDEEVNNLDRILDLLVPGNNEITVSKIKLGPSQFIMSLDWVDFKKLAAHEYAQHELTKLSATGSVVSITDIISWVEWLEKGATIRGYQFFRPSGPAGVEGKTAFSRSGEGLMKEKSGSAWTFEPTRIFERIAKEEENGKFIKKGFGLLVRRLIK